MKDAPKRCKDCDAEQVATNRPAPHPGPRCATHHRKVRALRKAVSHDMLVQRVSGLGPGDYDRLYAAQGGRCAICRRATGKTKKLAVDHDHATGEVRGLACSPCNRLLGVFRDSPEALFRAGLYLINPPARSVLTDRCDPDTLDG